MTPHQQYQWDNVVKWAHDKYTVYLNNETLDGVPDNVNGILSAANEIAWLKGEVKNLRRQLPVSKPADFD